jgi:hypothetical protein
VNLLKVGLWYRPAGWGRWHHHGDQHVVAYVLAGTIHVDPRANGNGVIQASGRGSPVRRARNRARRELQR